MYDSTTTLYVGQNNIVGPRNKETSIGPRWIDFMSEEAQKAKWRDRSKPPIQCIQHKKLHSTDCPRFKYVFCSFNLYIKPAMINPWHITPP